MIVKIAALCVFAALVTLITAILGWNPLWVSVLFVIVAQAVHFFPAAGA